ncbi:C4-dicarboxylate TRAP transporter small permease protein DctQ [Ignatzschineria indica]|uniref:TRAP transporter small permease protein n=1 Tax=Ignatzschineria indica TaxID=472583 RepID=A0A2U2ALV9_9GAMM|nr:TRAP transporter small permease [Ignatzschineria indica]PWD84165.1 TRAP transporter small permease [Ignatzschineria indica]GGZ74392.1 C4-dicarboxylate TRAP transporter small permease protein DctQ [Ignatzschineria indica]
MFISTYQKLDRGWQQIEKFVTVLILSAMTFVTFIYTMLNNLYTPFYSLADWVAGDEPSKLEDFLLDVGDSMMDLATSMNWSNRFTAACFAWLIFFCMSYGVRIGGHIGVDALVKLFHKPIKRLLAYIGLGACLLYGGIMLFASLDWVLNFYKLGTLAEDLDRFGIRRWHITMIVPVGFFLLILRYLEIGYKIITHQQDGLGLADEAKDALEEIAHAEHVQLADDQEGAKK